MSTTVALEVGQIWAPQRGPWATSNRYTARILDLKDGWVRYFVNEYAPDERMREDDFRQHYVVLMSDGGEHGALSVEEAAPEDLYVLLAEVMASGFLPSKLHARVESALRRRPQ